MIRYRLDELGWYQFENLMQTLLKLCIGLGVEAWGGSRDRGRDAYWNGPLRFPLRDREEHGPFVFQAKFIEGANGAGAKPMSALLSAVRKEMDRINERRAARQWEEPRTYVLFTNAPISSSGREAVTEIAALGLPLARLHVYGGQDVCALLDDVPHVRRAFPEILGIRDLEALLSDVTKKEMIERSRAAIREAADLACVFVTTSVYRKAREVLQQHHFVVLDGPPEMGKTAVARMLGMAELSEGKQVIECRHPNDFFAQYDRDTSQVFIADDAFGRTEYIPSLGREWERDLVRVLRMLDTRHWLLWTSRKHILQRALREMD